MKNNKVLIIIAVVLLNALVVFTAVQSLMNQTDEYGDAVAEARAFAEKELCSKSIKKYKEALEMTDSSDLRMEMIDVYRKGIQIGEFSGSYEIFRFIDESVQAYSDDAEMYEKACEMYTEYNKTEECAELLLQAKQLGVTSDKIEECRENIRYKYSKHYATYTDVVMATDGTFAVQLANGRYTFLGDTGSVAGGTYLLASTYSEGYAFVKTTHPDGEDRSVIIDKSGERQVYLSGVVSSSGVGKITDGEETKYYLACSTGETSKYFDINGNEVFGDYAFAGRFRNNIAAVKEKTGEWRIIDGKGNYVTDTSFSDIILNESDECSARGTVIAKTGEKYHLYSLSGEQVGDFSCDNAKAFVGEYAAFERDGLWGYVSADGKIVIQPQYKDAKSFSCGLGAVLTDEGWMFVNADNEVVINEAFKDIGYLNSKGVCFVKTNNERWSYIKFYYNDN